MCVLSDINRLDRAVIARALRSAPSGRPLYGYFVAGHAAETAPPLYVHGQHAPVAASAQGSRQGCPLGSTYFCFGLQLLLLELRALFPTLRIGACVDDVGLQGPVPDLERACAWLRVHGPRYGYHLNPAKCVVVPPAAGPFSEAALGAGVARRFQTQCVVAAVVC